MAIITSEELFEAIDILIKEQIDKIGYDTTVICKITDITKRPLGIYRVSNGSSTFDAYSDRTDYQVGDQVRITIPNGNYDEKKWIEGKYISETEEDLAAASLDATSGAPALTGELVVAKTNTAQIKVNSEKYKQIPLITDLANVKKALTYSNLFNVATLKADFKTAVRYPQRDIETGEYGIELRLVYEDQTSISYKLSSADMIGDPYYFLISSSQELSFLLEDTDKKITDIQLYLYENGLFKYVDNALLSELDMSITASNISLSFGVSIQDKADNSATIFTLSDDKYGRRQNSSIEKQIGLFWCNKTDSEYTGFGDGIFDTSYDEDIYLQELDKINNNEELTPEDKEEKKKELQEKNKNRYCIYWYKYNPQATENNDNWIKDLGWERIPFSRKNLGIPQFETPNTVEEKIYYAPYPIMRNNFYYIFANLKEGRIAERFQAVVIYNHTAYRSNILTFTNEQADPNYYVSETLQNFYLAHYKDSQDNFPFYNEWYKLDNKEDLTTRSICVKYSAIDNLDTLITNGGTITWRIPKKNNMLHYAGVPEGIELAIVEGEDFNDYSWPIPIIEEGEEENKTIKIDYSKLFIQYTINNEYREVLNNNTIKCIIKYDTLSTELEKTFMFSKQGNSGTEYTIITSTEGQVAVLPNSPLKINTRFTNGKGEEVETEISVELIPSNNGYEYNTEQNILSKKTYFEMNGGYLYCHLKISATLNDKTISTIEPVAYAIDNYYLKGATQVIYNYDGTHPSYTQDPYQLFTIDGEEITGIDWTISYEKADGSIISSPDFPIAVLDNGCLKPISAYDNNETDSKQYIVVKAKKDDKIIYAQSVYFGIDVYTNTFFNNWNGTTQLDSELFVGAPILMAGSKNAKNQFSGIVLGDVGQAINSLSTGLYGFDKGEAAYAFKTDGTAYLGKQGSGRIYFNGEKGVIHSSYYNDDGHINPDSKATTGSWWDLDNGQFFLASHNGAGIKLDTLDDIPLQVGGGSAIEQFTTFNAYLAYSNGKVNKQIEPNEEIKEKDIWYNEEYYFDKAQTVYLTGAGLKDEYFIATISLKDAAIGLHEINSHGRLNGIDAILEIQAGQYLIVNHPRNAATSATVSTGLGKFEVSKDGSVSSLNAHFTGTLNADKIITNTMTIKDKLTIENELNLDQLKMTANRLIGLTDIESKQYTVNIGTGMARFTMINNRPVIQYISPETTASVWVTIYLDDLQ